jgi:hypothetical protein
VGVEDLNGPKPEVARIQELTHRCRASVRPL